MCFPIEHRGKLSCYFHMDKPFESEVMSAWITWAPQITKIIIITITKGPSWAHALLSSEAVGVKTNLVFLFVVLALVYEVAKWSSNFPWFLRLGFCRNDSRVKHGWNSCEGMRNIKKYAPHTHQHPASTRNNNQHKKYWIRRQGRNKILWGRNAIIVNMMHSRNTKRLKKNSECTPADCYSSRKTLFSFFFFSTSINFSFKKEKSAFSSKKGNKKRRFLFFSWASTITRFCVCDWKRYSMRVFGMCDVMCLGDCISIKTYVYIMLFFYSSYYFLNIYIFV